jgi:hypothetical protein
MGETPRITDVGLGKILTDRPELEFLTLDRMGVTDAGAAHL